jgi:hypothetical protein
VENESEMAGLSVGTNPSHSIHIVALFYIAYYSCNSHINPRLVTRTDEKIPKKKEQERENKVIL